jgi:hypothetical protein
MDDIRHKPQAKPTRFLDQLRLHIRQQGLAYKTEQTYIHWVKRFIYFHNKQHLKNLGIKVSGTAVSRTYMDTPNKSTPYVLFLIYIVILGA